AAVPSTDIAPEVPGGTSASDVIDHVRRPHALPISLAIVSLPPATSAATNARRAPSSGAMTSARTAAMAETPVLAIAFPGPRRQRGQPQECARRRGDRQVVVEPHRHRFDKRGAGGGQDRRRDRERHRGLTRDRRPAPPGQTDAGGGAADRERRAAAECLLAV